MVWPYKRGGAIMTRSENFYLFAAATALLAQSANAQSLRDIQHDGVKDTRASAAITIPLGALRGSAEAKPRFDFTLATQDMNSSSSVTPMRFDPNFKSRTLSKAKLSFTLEQNPRLLINDQRVATFGPRLTADEESEDRNGGGSAATVLYVVGGVALLGVVSGIVVREGIEDSIQEVFDPED